MSKFYMDVDPDTRIVRNWYANLNVVPTAPSISEISETAYNEWHGKSATFSTDGKFASYTPPAAPIKEQAAYALQQARTTVYNNYGILNKPTPDAWVSYLESLMAIENGSDTISKELPSAPTL